MSAAATISTRSTAPASSIRCSTPSPEDQTMSRRVKIALVQSNAWDDMAGNVAQISALVRKAKADGAEFVATPENSGFMGLNAAPNIAAGRHEDLHPAPSATRHLARDQSVRTEGRRVGKEWGKR